MVDRVKSEAGIVVHEVVEAPRTHRPAGRDGTRYNTRGDEVDDRLADHVGVNRQVPPVGQVGEHLVRYPAQTDLKGGSIFDESRDVPGDLLSHFAGGLVQVLHDGRLHRNEAGNPINRDPAVARGARHGGIDLSDHGARRQRGGHGHVYRYTEAAGAVGIRGGDLHHRNVEREPPVLEQARNVGEGEREILHHPSRAEEVALVGPDVEDAVAISRMPQITGAHPVDEEMHQHHPRAPQLLQGTHQGPGSRARAADEDPVAGSHHGHGFIGGYQPLMPVPCPDGGHARGTKLALATTHGLLVLEPGSRAFSS